MRMPQRLVTPFGLLALTALSVFLYGFVYNTHPNLDQIVPFIQKIRNPALYPHDPYISTLAAFPSLYPYLMAWLSRLIPLPLLHWLLYLPLKYLLLDTAFRLTNTLFPRSRAGWIAAFLFACSPLANAFALFGEDPIMKNTLYHSSCAGPLALLALLFFVQERYVPAFAMLGSVYYLNGLLANFVAIMFGFATRRAPRPVWRGWVTFAAIVAPWLIWYTARPNVFGGPTQVFISTLRAWDPGHYFPSGWAFEKWKHIGIFIAYLMFFLIRGLASMRPAGTVRAFLWAFGAMWLAALVFGEWLPIPQLIALQFFRSDVLFVSLGLIFAAAYLQGLLETKSIRDVALAGLLVLVLTEIATPFYALPALVVLLLSQSRYRRASEVFLWGFLLVCVSDLVRTPLGMKKTLLVIAGLSVLLMARPKPERSVSSSSRVATAWVLGLALVPFLSIVQYRAATRDFAFISPARRDWEVLQVWLRAHTPVESIFIVPPDWDGFRVFSERTPFVEWIDAAAMHWAPGFEREWRARLEALGLGPLIEAEARLRMPKRTRDADEEFLQQVAAIYRGLPAARFQAVADRFGARYLVTEADHVLPFPLRYRNAHFNLYEILPPAGAARRGSVLGAAPAAQRSRHTRPFPV